MKELRQIPVYSNEAVPSTGIPIEHLIVILEPGVLQMTKVIHPAYQENPVLPDMANHPTEVLLPVG